ncbi:MAG: undecaprenyldiphospho-muramoylpentapeptide beta-N-acetylglucosaminyltransferase, partial [Pseudomonadota bacterium]|nr:undecaprenyldiphospho-muramoylpentapeptide beta-N-acetylglucosaminyltransferase [Pseudomonadota bacterium]
TGGTGGHIFPAIALAEFLKKRGLNIMFITDPRGQKNEHLSKFNPTLINVIGFAGKNLVQKLKSLFLISIFFIRSLIFLKIKKADLVIGFGSYVQVPVIIAAKILKIKIVLHEANLVLGKANRNLWHLAKIRISAFNVKNSNKPFRIVGMPVRNQIKSLHKKNYKFPRANEKINILILGGSLGALSLSKNISKQICLLPLKIRKRIFVIHQSKAEHIKYINSEYEKNEIKSEVSVYFKDIHKEFNRASLVVCRAGASTMAENLIAGLPAIYIPLASSVGNHQKYNAEMIKENNAGWIILEKEIFQPKFFKLLLTLLNSGKILRKISKNCKKLSTPYASENIYKLVLGELSEKF